MAELVIPTGGSPQNFALANKAVLRIPALDNFELFCVTYNIPGVSTPSVNSPTPFSDLKFTANKMVFEDLQVEFLIDEGLNDWAVIFQWMSGVGRPQSYNQYKNRPVDVTDATLHIFNQSNVEARQLRFYNMHPTYLQRIDFDTQDTSSEPLRGRVIFTFDYYDLVPGEAGACDC